MTSPIPRKITSVVTLENLGRVRLSDTFFMRDFLHSEVANFHGIPNFPEDIPMAIAAGERLCQDLLEPLQNKFGRIAVRSGYRSKAVNGFCSAQQRAGHTGYPCGSNEYNYAGHIWDARDKNGYMGATASVVVPRFATLYNAGKSWTELAWWIHDHLPYGSLWFFPKNAAFNINWSEKPARKIQSYVAPKGTLTKPSMENHTGDHSHFYDL